MGLEAGQAQPELGGNWGRSKAPALLLPPPHALRAHLGGSPRLGGLLLQFAASYRGFQLHREAQGPQKITAHECAPAPQPRGGGGGAHPNSCGSPDQDADEHPAPSARAGGLGSPQNRLPAPLQTVRLPAGKGRAQPCWKPRKLPFPREAAGQYDSKSYFTVAKERHVSREKSAGQRRGIPAPGAQCALSFPLSPKPCRISSLRGDPGPCPSTDHLPHRRILLTQALGGSQGPIQSPLQDPELDPPSHAPKASSRAKQETLLLVFLPLAPVPPAPGFWSCSPQGGGLLSPRPWLKSDPAQKNISYRQQNQTKNKAAASEVPVPVPARHLGAGGRHGREGSS